jgi:hypothetical protein
VREEFGCESHRGERLRNGSKVRVMVRVRVRVRVRVGVRFKERAVKIVS